MLLLISLQVLLPLMLIACLALKPPRDGFTLVLHGAAVAVLVVALMLVGLWTLLPWWLAWAWLVLGLWATVIASRRPKSGVLPRGVGWLRTAALALVMILAGTSLVDAIAGRALPPGRLVELRWPLGPGAALIANGGSRLSINSHIETLDLTVPRHRLWQGQSHAVDIVGLDSFGRSTSGFQPADPAAYAIFGRPVLAPCAGEVVAAVDGEADQRVPFNPLVPDAGNHVLLRCGEADVLLAHLRRGSVGVKPGMRVLAGARLGAVGNSGSSNEPHLHIHAQEPGTASAPFSGRPLPMRIAGRYWLRGQRAGD